MSNLLKLHPEFRVVLPEGATGGTGKLEYQGVYKVAAMLAGASTRIKVIIPDPATPRLGKIVNVTNNGDVLVLGALMGDPLPPYVTLTIYPTLASGKPDPVTLEGRPHEYPTGSGFWDLHDIGEDPNGPVVTSREQQINLLSATAAANEAAGKVTAEVTRWNAEQQGVQSWKADLEADIAQSTDLMLGVANSVPYANLAAFPPASTMKNRGAIAGDTGAVYQSNGTTWGNPVAYITTPSKTITPAGTNAQAQRVVSDLGVVYDLDTSGAAVDGIRYKQIGPLLTKYRRTSIAPIDVREGGAKADAGERDLNAGTDSTAIIQAALNAAASGNVRRVTGGGLVYRVNDSITVPVGVELADIILQIGTNGKTGVLVNTRSKFYGRIIGRGSISPDGVTYLQETGIAPATADVRRAVIEAECEHMALGVNGRFAGGNGTNVRNWDLNVRVQDIVGRVGFSQGYGLLLPGAVGCKGKLWGENIVRHGLYLSAGARDNVFDVDLEDVTSNSAVQLNTATDQPSTEGNTVTGKIRNSYVGCTLYQQAAASGLSDNGGATRENDIRLTITGGSNSKYALLAEGLPGATGTCRNNNFDGTRVLGAFVSNVGGTKSPLVKLRGTPNATWRNCTIAATHDFHMLALEHGALAGNVSPIDVGLIDVRGGIIDTMGGANTAIYSSVVLGTVAVNNIELRTTGAKFFYSGDAQTYRTGSLRRARGNASFADVPAGGSAELTVTWPQAITAPRITATVTSVSGVASGETVQAYSVTSTSAKLRAFNKRTQPQTIDVHYFVEGD
ncbi:hypothetical protein ACFOPQ_01180 [Deinococcus antarcticus]|uniref:Uncharacterized protein n=1 Tax=Deinococcus antarcticus TaxID=1298767 RepID=A0ABV8A158_9DEIO